MKKIVEIDTNKTPEQIEAPIVLTLEQIAEIAGGVDPAHDGSSPLDHIHLPARM